MGANVSKTSQQILTKNTTDIVNQVITQYGNTQSNTLNNLQVIQVHVSKNAVLNCGSLNATQGQNVVFSALMKINNEDTKELANTIVSKLAAQVASMTQQENSGINLGQANVNVNDSNIQQIMQTNVQSALKTTIDNTLKNNATNTSIIDFTIDGRVYIKGDCNFSQSSQVQYFSEMAALNIGKSLISNYNEADATAESKNTVTQTNAGINWPWLGGGIFGFIGFILVGYIIFTVIKKKKGQ